MDHARHQGGGEESQCGWLKDRFGLSWQVSWPKLVDMLMDQDKQKAGRAMQAMLKTGKLDVAALEKAYAGKRQSQRRFFFRHPEPSEGSCLNIVTARDKHRRRRKQDASLCSA